MITISHLIGFSVVLIGAVALALYGIRYRERLPEARRFPVFRPLSHEVGKAAEEGALIHIALGNGAVTGENAMVSVAALEGLTALCDLSAAYDTPPIITTGDPTLYVLADDWMRRPTHAWAMRSATVPRSYSLPLPHRQPTPPSLPHTFTKKGWGPISC